MACLLRYAMIVKVLQINDMYSRRWFTFYELKNKTKQNKTMPNNNMTI